MLVPDEDPEKLLAPIVPAKVAFCAESKVKAIALLVLRSIL